MVSTVGLELKNFINTGLTWKTVTKGFRSASRRSRKPARSLNVDVQLDDKSIIREDDKSIRREESSVSESEKLGVAVLGRRFADKVEHVPIKKRKLLLRSPSPPPRTPSPLHEEALSSQSQTPSPQPEDSDQTIDSKCASDPESNQEIAAFNGPVGVQFCQRIENGFVKPSDVNGQLGCTEDFSGIALLAAAACNNSISDAAHGNNIISDAAHNVKEGPIVDEFLTPEGIDNSISATTLERTTKSLESGNLLLKDSAHEDNIDGSPVQDYSVAVSQSFCNNRDFEAGKRPASMKDDRLHWDLNTVMEACDDLNIGSQINGSEGISDDVMHDEKPEKLEGGVKCRDSEHALEQVKYSTADTEVSTQVASKDKSLDNSPCSGSDPTSSRLVSEEKINPSPTKVVMQERGDCCGTSAMQLGKMVSIENFHLGKHDVMHHDLAVSEKAVCEDDSIETKEDSRKTSCLPDNGTSQTEFIGTFTCQTPDVEYYASKSGKAGPPHPSTEYENVSALNTTLGEGQPVVAVDVEEKQDKEAPKADSTPMDSAMHVEPKELMSKSYECFGKITLEDLTDDGYDSDISHDGHGLMVGVEKMAEIQAGYESPFEDGELRESVVYCLEENEVEGDTECVDYDFDNRNSGDFDAANQCMSEVGSDSCQNVDNGSLVKKVMQQRERANVLKESSHLVSLEKFSGQDQLPEGCECSTSKTGEANNVSTRNILASDSMDGFDVKGSSVGEVGSRATKGKYLSHVEGSSCSDALHRKDTPYTQRSSYDLCFRAERVFGSGKSLGRNRPALQMQDGGQGDGHWVDSPTGYWDSRNHYPNGYHYPQGTGRPRPRSVIANSAAKVDGLTYRDRGRCINYSSKGLWRPLIRRRSPVDDDDTYTVHRRMVAARDNSHMRSRGRSGIFCRGFIRGSRGEYHGPTSEDPASSSVRLPHYLSRRERRFSPVLSRGPSFSRRRRNSRSRSPLTWHSHRERNMGVRRHSRSPDFRSEATVERIRMPSQKPNYEADEDDVFISPPRSRLSSRWINDQNCVATRFRERKSPGRLFGRSQRFDSVGSPRRMKSDDYFRSRIRPEMFTELSGGAGRGHKYEGSDSYRTKHGTSYQMIHRVRHCDTSVVRRFRYDAEDCFEVHDTHNEDSCIRGTDRSNVPRSAREVRGPFRYDDNERMYAAGPKLSGIRGYDQ